MTDVLAPAAEEAPVLAQAPEFDPKTAIRSVGISIVVNAVLPFAIYKLLVPYFPNASVMPLLYAATFPVLGLIVGLIRTRVVDAISIFALFGIVYSIATTLLAGEVHLALILGSTQGYVIALAFLVSALMGRPLFFYMSRQFMAGNDPVARTRFDAVNAADNGRTFFIVTMAWAAGIAIISIVSTVLAFALAPATYLLVNNIFNTLANIALVVWSIRFTRARLSAVGETLAITTPA